VIPVEIPVGHRAEPCRTDSVDAIQALVDPAPGFFKALLVESMLPQLRYADETGMSVPEVREVDPSFLSATASGDLPCERPKTLHELHRMLMTTAFQVSEHAMRAQMRVSVLSCEPVFLVVVVFFA